MQFSKSLEGYIISLHAEGLSPSTIRMYSECLRKLVDFLRDPEIENITEKNILDFLNYRRNKGVTESTIHVQWRAIRSFCKWAEAALEIPRPDLNIKAPKFQTKAITPYTQDEVTRLIRAADSKRSKALIMVLMDTGLRIGELCRLVLADMDLESGEVFVRPFMSGKKSRARTVYLGRTTRQVLWSYLSTRRFAEKTDPVFTTLRGKVLTRTEVAHILVRIARKAGVANVHPHRFRHTFAVEYLRNDGDVFTLQRLLGHATLEMVRHYLTLAESDARKAHARASPVDHWRL
jgi:integrase/recombinase XerD